MEQIKEIVSSFYKNNKHQLETNYPGLSVGTLLYEFENLFFMGEVQGDLFLESVYLKKMSDRLQLFFDQLAEGMPLSYITHKRYFYKSSFYVSPAVLIPRFETEILVEQAVKLLQEHPGGERKSFIDVGTGSGVIGLSILKELTTPVDAYLTDISFEALKVATKNHYHLQYTIHPESRVSFLQLDRLETFNQHVDFVFTNPPYIKKRSDVATVHSQVRRFEPTLALFIDDQKYEQWFKVFLNQIFKVLKSNGRFIMEGHELHLVKIKEWALESGFSQLKILQDYTNRDRFLIGVKSGES